MARALAAMVLAAAVACGGSSRAPGPPGSTPLAEPVVEEATDAGQPRIEILSVGAEPRQLLRLTVAVGTSAGADVAIEMSTRTDDTADAKTSMAFGWTGGVMSVGDSIRVENRFDRIEIDGDVVEHGKLPFTYSLLPTATVASFDVLAEAPPPMDAALAESARQALAWLVVFPRAPVGVGARWRVDTEYPQNGVPVAMTVTSELVTREGTHARIRGTMTFRSAPDLAARVEGTGTIDVDLDLTCPVPTSRVTLVFSGEIRIDTTTTTLRGDSTMKLTPRR